MLERCLLIGIASAIGFGCASSRPVETEAGPEESGRNAAWGPTADDGFRDPFGFQGRTIFDELDLPTPNVYRAGSGAPGHAYWQQKVDYRIDATLDADARAVTATATVTYHNNAPDALDYLWLHLEQNLFRPDSVGSRATEPETRFGYRNGFEGGYTIQSITAGDEPLDLQVFDTMGRIDLAEPIEPGETFVFEIAWRFNIPPFGADRMGMQDNEQGTVFEIAQWFPAVAAYDDVRGWNTLGYLGAGEFYTNFGDYRVSITAPRDHVVVASGVLVNAGEVLTPEAALRLEEAWRSDEKVTIRSAEQVADSAAWPEGDGPLTWRFEGRQMRTFAWASSSAFIWDAASIPLPDGPHTRDGRVLIEAAYPKEAAENWKDAVAMAQHSVAFNSDMWHPYPYATATNVHGTVGGMEYPGIVFCGARTSSRGLYGVTDHEFGHAWFPMMVNTDERRHAWMDEGFNSFLNIYTVADYYDQDPVERRSRRRGRVMTNQQPVTTFPDRIWRGRLGYLAYGKPAAGLFVLREHILGPERFDPAFRAYIRRWAFKHPQPADFFRTMEDVAGADLAWFWRGWFDSTAELDQAVVGVEQVADYDGQTEGDQPWVFVDLENRGDMVMPVFMEVTYADGSTDRLDLPVEVWSTTNKWTAGFDPGDKTVTRVTLDPDRVLPDTERGSNVWPEGAEDQESEDN